MKASLVNVHEFGLSKLFPGFDDHISFTNCGEIRRYSETGLSCFY